MSLEETFTAGAAVESLLAHPGWDHIGRLLDAEIAEIDRKVDGSLLESKSEYAFLHGRRGGIRFGRDVAEAILSRSRQKLEEQRAKHERSAESLQEA